VNQSINRSINQNTVAYIAPCVASESGRMMTETS